MNPPTLLDTGPLVAIINRREQYHAWAKEQVAVLEPPFLTCEAVLSEACFLLRRVPNGIRAVMDYLDELVVLSFRLDEERASVAQLLDRYANVPTSLADACLVRMAELYPRGVVFTLDSDIKIYRKNGRQVIPTLMPPERG